MEEKRHLTALSQISNPTLRERGVWQPDQRTEEDNQQFNERERERERLKKRRGRQSCVYREKVKGGENREKNMGKRRENKRDAQGKLIEAAYVWHMSEREGDRKQRVRDRY